MVLQNYRAHPTLPEGVLIFTRTAGPGPTVDHRKVTRFQFKMSVAKAFTVHAVQGKTAEQGMALALSSVFTIQKTYVALSRVKRLDQLILLNDQPSLSISNFQKPWPKDLLIEIQRLKTLQSITLTDMIDYVCPDQSLQGLIQSLQQEAILEQNQNPS